MPRLNPALARPTQPPALARPIAVAVALHAVLLAGLLSPSQLAVPETPADATIEVTLETLAAPTEAAAAPQESAVEPATVAPLEPQPAPSPIAPVAPPPADPTPVPAEPTAPSPAVVTPPVRARERQTEPDATRPLPPTLRARPPIRRRAPEHRPDVTGGERPSSPAVGSQAASSPPSPASPPPAATAVAADAGGAWRGALAAWLQAHQSYPEAARRDGVEGRVIVRFTMDAGGTVTAVALVGSSGSPLLDEAAVALLRGSRLPAPPPPAPDHLSITLPVRYRLAP